MDKRTIIRIPSKVIVSGEHAVVYGAPAIVTAVDLFNVVSIQKARKNFFGVTVNNENFSLVLEDINNALKNDRWKRKKNLGSVCAMIIAETLRQLPKKKISESGFNMKLKTSAPIGSGLGHSAALSAGIAMAVILHLQSFGDEKMVELITNLCEKRFHGNPSGVDQYAVIHGGANWFRHRKRKIIRKIAIDKRVLDRFFLIDTGRPSSSTKEAVIKASRILRNNGRIIEKFEMIAEKIARALKEGDLDLLKKGMKENQFYLKTIGVSSKKADQLISKIEKIGGACKITGAGTARGHNVGMLLAFHENGKLLKEYLTKRKMKFYQVRMEAPGLFG